MARAGVNSVRGRLVLLTISLLVPALLSMGFLLAGADRQGRAQLHEQMLATARALSGATDRQAAVGIAVAETLTTDQALLAGDWAAFHARARRVTDQRSGWVVVTDSTGQQIVNTLRPYGTPLPVTPRPEQLANAYRMGLSKVSDLRMGIMARKPVITVGTPVTIRGKPYVLAYVVEASSFTSVFRQQRVPDRWVATLLDNNRKVIARSIRHEKWVGHSASADMTENLRRSNEGVNRSKSLDGVPTMVAYTRSPQTGWTLVVAIPRADMARTVTRSVVAATGVFLLLLVLGIGLALFFSRGINREVGRLVSAAHAIGQGQPVVAPAEPGLEEIAAIHVALSDASGELQTRAERQKVMINELNHRVKNTLATVQALARQTFGKLEGAAVEVFTERLIALSGAHDLLTRGGWSKADLGELMQVCTRAHGERVECVGPEVFLDPHTAVALSMVFHELATNSAKYGALSAPAGRVGVNWRIDPETGRLTIVWTETGGPTVIAPSKPGFGTRLIDSSIRRELKGTPNFDFRPEGLVFEASLPLPAPDAVRWTNPF
ncbi:MAG: histidine kinase [Caulobacter sp. 12-67-6]|nr:MAG: histidine kinase [Caulobacter sp. 12-67-6]OYX70935.1 MAG: histidine kinase [Caulobacter sp. 32-67-35]OYX96838.1 MAG: histidine kinase [Caulobacter sp. 35-67-4]